MSDQQLDEQVADLLKRASDHEQVAEALRSAANNEWSLVCYFYSAYQYLKAALLLDPIFDDDTRLKAKSKNLCMEDRYCTKHHGGHGLSSRQLGLNEIVLLLYPSIKVEYRMLHTASVDVRYRNGSTLSPKTAAMFLEQIQFDYEAGNLNSYGTS